MPLVYFDRNVFADICELRNGLTADDVTRLQRAVDVGIVTIPASAVLFEETIVILRESEAKYDQHIKTLLGLVDNRRMIKEPKDIIKDDCYNYAFRLAPNFRTMPTPRRLQEILQLSLNKKDLISLAEECSSHFKRSASSITEGLMNARKEGERKGVGHPDSFQQLWKGLAEGMAANLLNLCPTEIQKKCIKRGVKGMLHIKSIRLFTIYFTALIHSGWFGVQGQPRRMKPGDLGDWYHAMSASAANIFVTQESKKNPSKLGFILSQIPTPGLDVLNLSEFLSRI